MQHTPHPLLSVHHMTRRTLGAEFVLRGLLFLTAAGLSEQVSVFRASSCRAGGPGRRPDADEGGAVAEAEQDVELAPTKQLHAAETCVQGEHGQDAATLQVPQAQLSWIVIATEKVMEAQQTCLKWLLYKPPGTA